MFSLCIQRQKPTFLSHKPTFLSHKPTFLSHKPTFLSLKPTFLSSHLRSPARRRGRGWGTACVTPLPVRYAVCTCIARMCVFVSLYICKFVNLYLCMFECLYLLVSCTLARSLVCISLCIHARLISLPLRYAMRTARVSYRQGRWCAGRRYARSLARPPRWSAVGCTRGRAAAAAEGLPPEWATVQYRTVPYRTVP
jgi:hypothetical protein